MKEVQDRYVQIFIESIETLEFTTPEPENQGDGWILKSIISNEKNVDPRLAIHGLKITNKDPDEVTSTDEKFRASCINLLDSLIDKKIIPRFPYGSMTFDFAEKRDQKLALKTIRPFVLRLADSFREAHKTGVIWKRLNEQYRKVGISHINSGVDNLLKASVSVDEIVRMVQLEVIRRTMDE